MHAIEDNCSGWGSGGDDDSDGDSQILSRNLSEILFGRQPISRRRPTARAVCICLTEPVRDEPPRPSPTGASFARSAVKRLSCDRLIFACVVRTRTSTPIASGYDGSRIDEQVCKEPKTASYGHQFGVRRREGRKGGINAADTSCSRARQF
jgi:hypothetical protein